MEEDVETKAKVKDEDDEDEDIYHSPKVLFRLAVWSNILAWVVVIIEIVLFGIKVYFNFFVNAQPGTPPLYIAANLISYLSPLLAGVAWFILLKAVSEVIYLLVDIYEKP
jgi:hypothetical protein